MLILAAGPTLALADASGPALVVSAAPFGLGMLMVPTSFATLVRARLPKPSWSVALVMLTIVFSAGQVVGPVLAGLISDATGSLRGGLAAGISVLAVGALCALAQRDVRTSRDFDQSTKA